MPLVFEKAQLRLPLSLNSLGRLSFIWREELLYGGFFFFLRGEKKNKKQQQLCNDWLMVTCVEQSIDKERTDHQETSYH